MAVPYATKNELKNIENKLNGANFTPVQYRLIDAYYAFYPVGSFTSGVYLAEIKYGFYGEWHREITRSELLFIDSVDNVYLNSMNQTFDEIDKYVNPTYSISPEDMAGMNAFSFYIDESGELILNIVTTDESIRLRDCKLYKISE